TILMLISNADAETTSLWQNGSSQSSFMVTTPGTYILSQENHCGESEDSINITYQLLPVAVDLGSDTALCPGETLLLFAPNTSDPISWQDGSHASSLLATQAGIYSLSVTNDCGTRSDEIELTYDDQFTQFPEEVEYEICPGNTIDVDVTQTFPATYEWSTGSTEPSISITIPDVYSVTVASNCQQASHVFEVILNEHCNDRGAFYIPNIISPNDDNINDVFTIHPGPGLEIIRIEGSIFDRWGNLVFSSSEIPFTWNGRFADEEVNPGVYVYALKLKYSIDGRTVSKTLTGDVTIVK
ncbi:MAG TPA: gliding motility-associated C-terminal domain-containing protein, partial [Saprospiraceae bacterium]|nr:gliding motility-associated C-terminal domain-containing protein [Saprospiraceae bacterium]